MHFKPSIAAIIGAILMRRPLQDIIVSTKASTRQVGSVPETVIHCNWKLAIPDSDKPCQLNGSMQHHLIS